MIMMNASSREALWQEFRPRLELYLRSFSALSVEDSEDILQRTLASYLERADEASAEAPGDHRAWLYRVARNAAIDTVRRLRREERWGRRVSIDPGIAEPESHYEGPEACAMDAAEADFVARFLAALADSDRELLHLAYAEGLAYPEIAAATGRPLGTVKWRMSSLRRRLKSAYDKEYS